MPFPKFTAALSFLAGGVKPRIKSIADLALALQWVARLKSHSEAVEAERKAGVVRVNEAASAALQIEVDGESVPLEQFMVGLHLAVERFVPQHKPEIFDDGTQTARFPAGEVSWRDEAPTVRLCEGTKASEIAAGLVKRAKLNEAVAAALEEAGLSARLRVKFELDLATIRREFAAGRIDKRHLPKGLEVTDRREDVRVKTYTGPERSDVAE